MSEEYLKRQYEIIRIILLESNAYLTESASYIEITLKDITDSDEDYFSLIKTCIKDKKLEDDIHYKIRLKGNDRKHEKENSVFFNNEFSSNQAAEVIEILDRYLDYINSHFNVNFKYKKFKDIYKEELKKKNEEKIVIKEVPIEVEKIIEKEIPVEVEKVVIKEVPVESKKSKSKKIIILLIILLLFVSIFTLIYKFGNFGNEKKFDENNSNEKIDNNDTNNSIENNNNSNNAENPSNESNNNSNNAENPSNESNNNSNNAENPSNESNNNSNNNINNNSNGQNNNSNANNNSSNQNNNGNTSNNGDNSSSNPKCIAYKKYVNNNARLTMGRSKTVDSLYGVGFDTSCTGVNCNLDECFTKEYSIANENIAKVSKDGVITGISKGTTKFTYCLKAKHDTDEDNCFTADLRILSDCSDFSMNIVQDHFVMKKGEKLNLNNFYSSYHIDKDECMFTSTPMEPFLPSIKLYGEWEDNSKYAESDGSNYSSSGMHMFRISAWNNDGQTNARHYDLYIELLDEYYNE